MIELIEQPSTELTVHDRAEKTEPTEPSDGDLIWTAQAAIAAEYGMTTQQAFNRLKAIDWTI